MQNSLDIDCKNRCPACGVPAKSLRCSACSCVAYCSKECQRRHWKTHKPHCMVIRPVVSGDFFVVPGSDKEKELKMRGTSNPDGSIVCDEAVVARHYKRNGQYDRAVAMYTRCLDREPYNHIYSFHRAETFFMAGVYTWAIQGARYTILLEKNYDVAWTLLIRCLIDTVELDQAEQICNWALAWFPRSAERYGMLKQLKQQVVHHKRFSSIPTAVLAVADYGDSLHFFYTRNLGKKQQPEILAVDLPVTPADPCSHRIMKFLLENKMKEKARGEESDDSDSLVFGTVFLVPKTKYWITPIPVKDEKILEKIYQHLMTQSDPRLGWVVVIKVDIRQDAPSPLSEEEANAYLHQIASNAHEAKIRYNRGEKLVN